MLVQDLVLTMGSAYRGTSLIRHSPPLGPYSRTMSGVLGGSKEGGMFLMGELPLYGIRSTTEAFSG